MVSGPSGAGKRTLLAEVLKSLPDAAYSVSATTRPRRPGEIEGQDYYFLSENAFKKRVDGGEFAEWATVHDQLYGTLNVELERLLGVGGIVILELDVQGMRSIKQARNGIITVFIAPPSSEEQENRLRIRGTKGRDLEKRLENAQAEMEARNEYDFVIVNENVEEAAAELRQVFRGKKRPSPCKT